ncbi:hypothetical protein, partial [Geobacter sp.]|uniref:hypothetical protein n=1 Tax=Geobacter sp. TaxID=46610 RepID=UPI00261A9FD3
RREWCARGIDLWLGTAKTAINFQYVIPTLQIETWLLATYDPDTFTGLFPEGISDYESITNVESLLLSMGYEEDKEKPGRLYKQKTLFENNVIYVPRLLRYIDKSTARCKELFNFKQLIENYC